MRFLNMNIIEIIKELDEVSFGYHGALATD